MSRGGAFVVAVALMAGAAGVGWLWWQESSRIARVQMPTTPGTGEPAPSPVAPATPPSPVVAAPSVPPAPVLPPDPPKPAVDPVARLSLVPELDWRGLLRAYARVAGGAEPWVVDAWSMLSDCREAEATRGQPAGAAVAERSRQAVSGAESSRLRFAVVTPSLVQDGALVVPVPGAGAVFSQTFQPALMCAARFGSGGVPRLILLQTVEPAPWSRRVPLEAGLREALEASPAASLPSDLVIDFAGPGGIGADGVLYVPVRMVALFVWRDEARTQPVAVLGHAAPDSQDRPVAALPPAPPVRRPAGPPAPDAPRLQPTPRTGVDVRPLPPPLTQDVARAAPASPSVSAAGTVPTASAPPATGTTAPSPPSPAPATAAPAAAARPTHIVTQDAALRAAPSLQADRLAVARGGERLAIDAQVQGPEGIPWMGTRLPDGRRVWVSGRLLRPLEPAP